MSGTAAQTEPLKYEAPPRISAERVLFAAMLAVRVHEIRTLAQAVNGFRRNDQQLADTLRGQLVVGADSFVDILTSPFELHLANRQSIQNQPRANHQ